MRKSNKNRLKGPRQGALVVTLVVLLTAIAIVAALFLFAPEWNAYLHGVKKTATLRNSSTAKLYPDAPAFIPPLVDQKPVGDKNTIPKADLVIPAAEPFSKPKPGTGLLAIIIDDMGSSMSEARSLAAIGVTVNFSIIPGLSNYRNVAQFAESSGIETMIHLPMQSKGWPGRRLEANGLLISMDDAELLERVSGFIRDIPGAVGANNHTGSEFTEHEDKMRPVLETLKRKNLFFIDSVTSDRTVGLRLAREMGIRSGRRDVFLDNEQERGYILGQLDQAVRLAKTAGSAIAIGHPHPETIATLSSALPGLAARGITLVPLSQLVR